MSHDAHPEHSSGEVLMEDGSWEPCEIVRDHIREDGVHEALVRWSGVTVWMFNNQPDDEPDEWRRS
jgi:hypothetical protein